MIRLPDRLPPLSGRWLTAYRVLWCAIFVFAVIGATVGSGVTTRMTREYNEATYRLGIQLSGDDADLKVSPLLPGTKPFAPQSELLAIDGKPVLTGKGWMEKIAFTQSIGGPEGTIHRLTLRDPQGHTHVAALAVRQTNFDAFDAQAPLPLATRLRLSQVNNWFSSALFLIAALLLFLRRVPEPVVALLSMGMLLVWAPFAPLAFGAAALADTFDQISLPTLFLGWGLLLFPSGRFEPRWTWAVAVALPIFIVLNAFDFQYEVVLALFVALSVSIVAANLVRYRRLASPIERQQLKWAVGGTALAVLLLIFVNLLSLLQRQIGSDSTQIVAFSLGRNALTMLVNMTLVGGLLISLLRYRLYDAETALSRSALYGALALAMIAVFAGTEKLVELLAEQYFGESVGAASGAIAAGVAAAIIPLFHRRLERWAERRFQGPLLALRDDLPSDLGDWRETAELPELARDALARVTAALRSHGGAIVTPEAAEPVLAASGVNAADLSAWLATHDPADSDLDRADSLLPLRVPLGVLPGRGPAFLLLGPRPDGTMPGKDEREAAAAVADPLARALVVTARRNAHDHALKTTLTDLSSTLTDLAGRLTRLEARSA